LTKRHAKQTNVQYFIFPIFTFLGYKLIYEVCWNEGIVWSIKSYLWQNR